MTPRVAITGGLGYLGGRIAKHLKEVGYNPTLLTRNTDKNLPGWTDGLNVISADISDVDSLEAAFSGTDQIIHLAAMNARECTTDPEAAEIVNIKGTANVVAAAKRAGVSRMIYMSTAHVYGAPLKGHLDELAATTNSHPYAVTHRQAEDIVLDKNEIKGVVLRLSNGIGCPANPEVNCWMLIANDLCRQAVCDGHLILRGSGQDKRDFIPISEVARAVNYFLRLDSSHLQDGLFNLGSGIEISTLTLAEKIAGRAEILFEKRPEIEISSTAKVSIPEFNVRTKKLAATGFAVNNNLDAEIDATLIFCRDHFCAD
jgi:UDP-glucose 4-epimerase